MRRLKSILELLQEKSSKLINPLSNTYRRVAYLGILGLLPMSVFAQMSEVNSALSGVATDVNQLGSTAVGIVKAIAGVLAIVALVTLVVKFQEGDHEAKKKLMMWIGALVVLFVALTIVENIFGIS